MGEGRCRESGRCLEARCREVPLTVYFCGRNIIIYHQYCVYVSVLPAVIVGLAVELSHTYTNDNAL